MISQPEIVILVLIIMAFCLVSWIRGSRWQKKQ